MIRALRPTDLPAYVAFCRRAQLGRGPSGPGPNGELLVGTPWQTATGFARRSLALEPGRATWVQVDRGRISGLVAARRRAGADVWDVDQLILLPGDDSGWNGIRLLERLLTDAIEAGVHMVFLRLPEDDPARQWVHRVGFFQYSGETRFFRAELPTFAHPPEVPGLRARRAADHQPLFQLYCATVPFRVRQAEGMTLHEWRWLDGWGAHPKVLTGLIGHARHDFVVDDDLRLTTWLQVHRGPRTLSLLADESTGVDVATVLRFGMYRLGGGGPASCAAREYQGRLAAALDENGFVATGRYVLFARALTARIPEVKLVPVRAS